MLQMCLRGRAACKLPRAHPRGLVSARHEEGDNGAGGADGATRLPRRVKMETNERIQLCVNPQSKTFDSFSDLDEGCSPALRPKILLMLQRSLPR